MITVQVNRYNTTNNMKHVSSAIQRYLSDEIALSKKDISASAASRDWFLKRLKGVIEADESGPQLYSVAPFVRFGSYFKGTKVKDVDEFDILVVVDSGTGVFSYGERVVGNGLGTLNPNPKYYPRFAKDEGGVSPTKLLNWLRDAAYAVVEPYGGDVPVRDGQAVTATIVSQNLKIDLVPAGIFARPEDGAVFYNIPKGDKSNSWILTAPEQDMRLLNYIAKDRAGFKTVIRILKRIRDTHSMGVCSFGIECAAIQYALEKEWSDELALDLASTLLHISEQFRSGSVKNPLDPSVNLIADVASADWYATRLNDICSGLLGYMKSSSYDSEDLYQAIRALFENE